MMGGGMVWGYGGWLGMIIGLLLIIGLVAGVAFTVTRDRPVQDAPLETLRVRLARGEITPEEYDHLRTLLITK